jgi:CubicO group peptidase (beta-lactamase class C family)/pimeloyl-ACP methyl ester carboxylesterase
MKRTFFFMIALVLLTSTIKAQRVDTFRLRIHNHDMNLYVSGHGKPIVVMEAGMGASHRVWRKVDSSVSRFTRVVSYDRPGYGKSDTCSLPRDAVTVARELKEALTKAGLAPPYVLAGWSLGGAFVRVFAGMYPNDVAGLILVDPAPEDVYPRLEKEQPEFLAEEAAFIQQLMSSNRAGEKAEMLHFDSSMNQAKRSDLKHQSPTILLIAAGRGQDGNHRDSSNPFSGIWIEELEKWGRKRPNLEYSIIRNSGHNMAMDQPDTVVKAINSLVSQYQAKLLKQSVSTYQKPEQLNDGIKTAHIKDVGMNETVIMSLTDSIRYGNYPNIHSILIFKDNKLVYENYFPGNDVIRGKGFQGFMDHHRDSLHDLRSVSKSIVATAAMLALAQGRIISPDQRIMDYFPEYKQFDTGLKRDITIRHLLNMSSGLEWDEDISYADPANSEIRMDTARHPMEFFLSRNMVDTPGSKFNYSGGCTQALALIIEKATGMPVDQFTNKFLFEPLGISQTTWMKRWGGIPIAASGLRMRSRDLGKIGLLYLNQGRWKDKQILPTGYLASIFTGQISTGIQTSKRPHIGYHYQFWIPTLVVDGEKITTLEASGNGGQKIIVDRKSNIVVVITAGNYNQRNLKKNSNDILPDFVYRAIER